jgi:hypothetical protein
MNIDLTQEEIQLIIRSLPATSTKPKSSARRCCSMSFLKSIRTHRRQVAGMEK